MRKLAFAAPLKSHGSNEQKSADARLLILGIWDIMGQNGRQWEHAPSNAVIDAR
jgi:hypothetical protein